MRPLQPCCVIKGYYCIVQDHHLIVDLRENQDNLGYRKAVKNVIFF